VSQVSWPTALNDLSLRKACIVLKDQDRGAAFSPSSKFGDIRIHK
jgi:hypothetical protein